MNGTQPRHESLASVGDNRRTTGTRPCPPLCHYRPLEPRRSLRSGRSRVHGAKSLGEKSWCWEEPQGRSFYTEFSRIAPSTCSLSLSPARSLSLIQMIQPSTLHTLVPQSLVQAGEEEPHCPRGRSFGWKTLSPVQAAVRRTDEHPGAHEVPLCLGKPGGVVRSKQKPSDSHSSKLTSVPSRTC